MFGDLEMTKKKMGSLGRLSQFSGIKRQEEDPAVLQSAAVEPNVEEVPPVSPPKEKLATINTKITRAQQQWLTDTARTVRENNSDPVPPSERVFPQHLIGVAVELLQKAEVDWSQVRNLEELRNQLNL
jgi:hypothetical protein